MAIKTQAKRKAKAAPKKRDEVLPTFNNTLPIEIPDLVTSLETVISNGGVVPLLNSNHFEWGDHLGDGGYSEVFAATYSGDDSNINKDVAIKSNLQTAKPHSTRAIGFARDNREEAETLNLLNHISFPKVYGTFSTKDEKRKVKQHLVLERIYGDSLSDTIVNGYTIDECVNLSSQLLDSISQIHNIGKINRDVKPENIIIQEDNTLRMIDLGCVTERRERTFAKTQAMGTWKYAAPDLTMGEAYARVDVYSAGVVMYEMFMGELITDFEIGQTHRSLDFDALRYRLEEDSGSEQFANKISNLINNMTKGDAKTRIQTVDIAHDRLKEAKRILEVTPTESLETEKEEISVEKNEDYLRFKNKDFSNPELKKARELYIKMVEGTILLKKEYIKSENLDNGIITATESLENAINNFKDRKKEFEEEIQIFPELKKAYLETKVFSEQINVDKKEFKKRDRFNKLCWGLKTVGFTGAVTALGLSSEYMVDLFNSYTYQNLNFTYQLFLSTGFAGFLLNGRNLFFEKPNLQKTQDKINKTKRKFKYLLFDTPREDDMLEISNDQNKMRGYFASLIENIDYDDYEIKIDDCFGTGFDNNINIRHKDNPDEMGMIDFPQQFQDSSACVQIYRHNKGDQYARGGPAGSTYLEDRISENVVLTKLKESEHPLYLALEYMLKVSYESSTKKVFEVEE